MEIMLLLILGLIVFGPGKLPEVMGQVGKAVRDFRRATGELSEEFNRTIQSEIDETKAAINGTPSTPAAPVQTATAGPPHTNGTAEAPTATSVATAEADSSLNGTTPNTFRPPQSTAAPEDKAGDLLPPY
jgi:TatA/E family protein of Tat protein translocase